MAHVTRDRLASVDVLRGAAALGVVLAHIADRAPRVAPSEPFPAMLLRGSLDFGRSGVMLFFILSGFCIHRRWACEGRVSGSVQDGPGLHLWPFWKRRMKRLWPPYVIAMAGYLLVQTAAGQFVWGRFGFYNVGMHLLMLHNLDVRITYGICGVFWSLAVEEQLYLAYPLLLLLRRRWGWRKTLMLGFFLREGWFLIYEVASAACPRNHLPGGECMLYSWLLFMLGAATAEWSVDRVWFPAWASRVPLAGGLLALAWCAQIVSQGSHLTTPGEVFNWQLSELIFLLGYWILLNGVLARVPQKLWARCLQSLGRMSYSLYLTHMLVLLGLVRMWGPEPGTVAWQTMTVLLLTGVPLALGVARVYYLLIERRFLTPRAVAQVAERSDRRARDRPDKT